MDTEDWRPSRKLMALLSGRTLWDEADPAIRSMARLHIFKAANTILAEQDKAKRRAMLAKIPENMRPHVKAEAERIASLR